MTPAPRASAPSASASAPPVAPTYPVAPRGPVADDPYRSLEDLDAPATRAWVAAENQLAGTTSSPARSC